ncbi:hypothetical protein [Rhodobacteraceae bacterium DSL-40]|uniref:hypothetical protein n=1 Tax=Amaricoccus sp. B4 TaxID=3368557 RepID=UPI000DAC6B67
MDDFNIRPVPQGRYFAPSDEKQRGPLLTQKQIEYGIEMRRRAGLNATATPGELAKAIDPNAARYNVSGG